MDCALSNVAIANANTAANPALELLKAAVMTSPLDLTFGQPDPLAPVYCEATTYTYATSLQPLDVSMSRDGSGICNIFHVVKVSFAHAKGDTGHGLHLLDESGKETEFPLASAAH